ncbi:hypothetical protein [Synechococcus sp. J7-Johnson]|uniref:hypothetical protein n=1 Tax=Synechococcus sp. J7-Johnson TaxID=2823737 RepID=UPI0020CDA5E3|nr:hypothetical protein [Synechococcus sp. J7-Johnson]
MDISSIPAAGAAAEPIRLRPIGVCIDEPWASGQRKRYLASLDPGLLLVAPTTVGTEHDT